MDFKLLNDGLNGSAGTAHCYVGVSVYAVLVAVELSLPFEWVSFLPYRAITLCISEGNTSDNR